MKVAQGSSKVNPHNSSVAVIMPTYNGELYLQEQVTSILNQSFRDFSLHIVDDRSTDQTAQIVSSLAEIDKRIVFQQNQDRKGVINSVNDALSSIDSDIYFLADQDDIWLPEKMAKQIKAMQPYDVVMSFTNLSLVDEQGDLMGIDFWSSQEIDEQEANQAEIIAIRTMVTGCTMAFKKRLLEIALPIPDQATMHDHWLSFFATKIGRIIPISEELVLYRQHSENVIGDMVTPRLQREKRYAGCQTYQDFLTQKQASFKNLLVSLEAFVERLEQYNLKDPLLKKYIAFYTSIVNRKWIKALRVVFQLKSLSNSVYFLRILSVTALFPWFYLLLKIHSIVEKTEHNTDLE